MDDFVLYSVIPTLLKKGPFPVETAVWLAKKS